MSTNSSRTSSDQWLRKATVQLSDAGISSARLDALILLEDATGKDRAWLLAHPEFSVQGSTLYSLDVQIARRVEHEPLAYIRGKSEFYGREFAVSNHTLQPRPETETMIELLKQLILSRQSSVVSQKATTRDWRQETEDNSLMVIDIGTGSGCIAITSKLEFPDLQVMATDISKECLKVARKNARIFDADIQFYEGNLLSAIPTANCQLPTTILANLPYVPDHFTINEAAMHEPATAIFGGKDGLDLYRDLFSQISNSPQNIVSIITESLPPQHEALADIAREYGYILKKTSDFIQLFERSD
jgi:release factor glutamine methyltransferase